MFTTTFSTREGFTARDHVLPEIVSQCETILAGKTFRSEAEALRAGDMTLMRVCTTFALYRGCSPGIVVGASR